MSNVINYIWHIAHIEHDMCNQMVSNDCKNLQEVCMYKGKQK